MEDPKAGRLDCANVFNKIQRPALYQQCNVLLGVFFFSHRVISNTGTLVFDLSLHFRNMILPPSLQLLVLLLVIPTLVLQHASSKAVSICPLPYLSGNVLYE